MKPSHANGGSGKRTGRIPLVYILAASHSGSTLLAMLLNAHSEICTVGELKATSLGDPDAYRCSCQQRIRECAFWNGIHTDMAERGLAFDITQAGTDIRYGASAYVRRLLRPLHRVPALEFIRDLALSLSPVWRKQLPRIQAMNSALMECVLARSGKRIIVDSSKIGIRLKYLLRNPRLDVRVIRLVRDGRGVALTYVDPERFADAKDPQLRGGGAGTSRDAERVPMEEAAREWLRSNEEAEAILGQLDPAAWTEVRYETLCAQPEKTLQKIYSFLGVDQGHPLSDFRAAEHHVVGNGMRLDANSEIQLDERWRKNLRDSDLEIFNAVAGAMNRRLGYQ